MSFLTERPWIVPVGMSVLFFISLGFLFYKQTRRKRAFNMIKSMKRDKELSKVYLRIDNGYGDFYDMSFSVDGENWSSGVLFSDEILTPSILMPHGEYEIKFSIKARSGVTAYYKKKGPFYTEVIVKPFTDTMIVFDNETLASWQEDLKE